MEFQALTSIDNASMLIKDRIANFLYKHLDQFGDKKEDILKCLDYALSPFRHQGGFVLMLKENSRILGVVVMNHTGMEGYIPENILVYIAVHRDHRGKGLGKKLMKKSIELARGDIALHVEHDNPARKLYESIGFTNKYLEYRLKKS
ncbi:MAG: GNAT family N-acetyltransferase [Candidatus Cyclobacteriaceae bacterium M3_2C_046]